MKKVTLFLLLLVVALSMNSQTLLESDSYGLDQYSTSRNALTFPC